MPEALGLAGAYAEQQNLCEKVAEQVSMSEAILLTGLGHVAPDLQHRKESVCHGTRTWPLAAALRGVPEEFSRPSCPG